MIQRIQTLYLLIIVALLVVMLFRSPCLVCKRGGMFNLYAFSLQSADGSFAQSTVYLGILFVLSALLPLLTIFLYRRRLLQIRLCVVEMVFLVGTVIMEAIYYFLSRRVFSELALHNQGFKPAIVLPIVALFFTFLAARAIFRDEMLVRSADRIR